MNRPQTDQGRCPRIPGVPAPVGCVFLSRHQMCELPLAPGTHDQTAAMCETPGNRTELSQVTLGAMTESSNF